MSQHRTRRTAAALCLGLAAGALSLPAQAAAPRLRFEQVLADSTAFDVVATLIIGPRHVLLWDAQYHKADAERVAEAIARSGRTLQAIVLSHPDEDHLSGVATLLERFPGTPVYLSRAGLQWFDSTAQARFQADRARNPELFPDSLPRPREWPSTRMELDGVRLELLPDLQGDVRMPTNTALWIPELRTVLAGDIVFRGVHPWLGSSDSASRAAWRGSLRRLGDLKPVAVIAGHKSSADLPDTPDVLAAMDRYLADFDSILARAATPREMLEAMQSRYPDLKVSGLLRFSVGMAYRARGQAPGAAAPGTAGSGS